MVDAILLVLREVLEAALIISLLFALSRKLLLQSYWLGMALILGLICSWLMAYFAYQISDALAGTGQEWLNAFLYLLVIVAFWLIAFSIFNISSLPHFKNSSSPAANVSNVSESIPGKTLLLCSCVLVVSLSLAREVAEIWIYYSGFLFQPDLLRSAITGGVIGLGIGISLGVITFYLLVFISARYFLNIFYLLLILICGALAMQIAKQLLQIGVLDSSIPLWDSSFIVSERSWLGELLYALMGYDATPGSAQIILYCAAVLPILLLMLRSCWLRGVVNA